MPFLKKICFLLFALCIKNSLLPTATAHEMSSALLKKSYEFYTKFKDLQTHRLAALESDDLNQLNPNDLSYLSNRIKIYGLIPFEINNTQMILSLNPPQDKLEIDYLNLDQSAISIKGINYSFNIYHPLKRIYEENFKKNYKQFKKETSFLNLFIKLPLSLQGCVDTSAKNSEAAVNSSSLPLAYLKLCVECASIAANPEGALVGVAGAAIKGVSAGIKNKSFKKCGIEFCRNLPGIKSFLEVSAAHKNASQQTKHSK